MSENREAYIFGEGYKWFFESSLIYKLNEIENTVFEKIKCNYISKNLSKSKILNWELLEMEDKVLDYECSVYEVFLENDYFDNQVFHKRYHANELYFPSNNLWELDIQMVSKIDNKICLKLIETRIPPPDINLPDSIVIIEAVQVMKVEVSDKVFNTLE